MLPSCLLASLLAIASLLSACGGGGDAAPEFPTVISLGEGDLFPSIVNTSLAVGENRVVVQLIDRDDKLLLDSGIRIRYFNLNGDEPVLSEESEARLITSELNFIDETNDFRRTVVGNTGVYVSYASFDEAGAWGAEFTIFRDGERTVIPYRFTVREQTEEPSVGDSAPASVQATTATEPIEEIDTSAPFRDAMHATTVADALKLGKPIVIAFATPAFCSSRTCGPIMDLVVDPLSFAYGQDVMFIHIEPYVLRDLREANIQNPVPTVLEWRLRTEPWIFVVDQQGRIAAKFEGIAARDEVDGVIRELLNLPPVELPTPQLVD
jgi:hypothetical protein